MKWNMKGVQGQGLSLFTTKGGDCKNVWSEAYGGTSRITVCVLFALPLLSSVGICAGRPVRVQLHVQLSLPSRQLIILGLFLSP